MKSLSDFYMHYVSQRKLLMPIIVAGTASLILTMVSNNLLTIAMPSIKEETKISLVNLGKILNIYFIIVGLMLPLAGYCVDKFNAFRSFIVGISLFICGTFYGILAQDTMDFIIVRVIQGLGASLMIPSSFTIMLKTIPLDKRGSILGLSGGIISIITASAPFLGGMIIQFGSWRMIFGLLLIGALSTVAWIGLKLASFSIRMINFTPVKKKSPRVKFSILVIVFCSQIFITTLFFWPAIIFYLFNYSPIKTGLIVTLGIFPSMAASWLAGRWNDQKGAVIPLIFFLATIPLFLTSFIILYAYPSIYTCFLSITLFSIPFGGINTLLVTLFMSQSDEGSLGRMYSHYTMMRNLGSGCGVLILERALEHNHVYIYSLWMLFAGFATAFFCYRFFKSGYARA